MSGGGISFTRGLSKQLFILFFWWYIPIYINLMMSFSMLNIAKAVLIMAGIAGALVFQHELHRYYGASSLKEPANMRKALMGLALTLLMGMVLTIYSTPWLWLWAALGLALAAAYTITRRYIYSNEWIAGLAWGTALYGSYTVFNNVPLPPLGVAVFFLGLSMLMGLMLVVHRVLSGDYPLPFPISTLMKIIVWLFIATMLMGAGLAL